MKYPKKKISYLLASLAEHRYLSEPEIATVLELCGEVLQAEVKGDVLRDLEACAVDYWDHKQDEETSAEMVKISTLLNDGKMVDTKRPCYYLEMY